MTIAGPGGAAIADTSDTMLNLKAALRDYGSYFRGGLVADVVAIIGTLDIVLGEVDR